MRQKYLLALPAMAVCLWFAGCEVEQTRQAELPDLDVDVDAEPGQLPAWDIDGPDVDVGVREETVSVPKVRFETENEEIKVPYIDINIPNETDREERELAVEFDVDSGAYAVDIEQVRAKGDDLYVIARLNPVEGRNSTGPSRVSDRVMLNAPDADVSYYVIGDRPEGSSATRYRFFGSENDLPERVRSARVIYQG